MSEPIYNVGDRVHYMCPKLWFAPGEPSHVPCPDDAGTVVEVGEHAVVVKFDHDDDGDVLRDHPRDELKHCSRR